MSTTVNSRADGRAVDELRPVTITRGFTENPAGSVLISMGNTRVMCTASVTQGVPRWRKGSGLGWLTAEYSMLPAATNERSQRESTRGKVGGRTHEISRLIGRSLRAAIDLSALGENTIALDCDVLQADGGTRTASITGAYVALADAVTYLLSQGLITGGNPLKNSIAAISVGVIDGEVRLDLPYEEDCRLVEVQGTAEGEPFDRAVMNSLLDMGQMGCAALSKTQNDVLAAPYPFPAKLGTGNCA